MRRSAAAVSAAAVGALLLAACGTSQPGGNDDVDDTPAPDTGGAAEVPTYEGTDKEGLGEDTTRDDDIYVSVHVNEWAGDHSDKTTTYDTSNSVLNNRGQGSVTSC